MAVADVNSDLLTFTLFFDKLYAASTPVTVLLSTSSASTSDRPVLLSSLLPLHSPHTHVPPWPLSAPCSRY